MRDISYRICIEIKIHSVCLTLRNLFCSDNNIISQAKLAILSCLLEGIMWFSKSYNSTKKATLMRDYDIVNFQVLFFKSQNVLMH